MKLGLTGMALAALLMSGTLAGLAVRAQEQSAVPDAPTPQALKLSTLDGGPMTPGKGAGIETTTDTTSSSSSDALGSKQELPSSQAPSSELKDNFQTKAPDYMNAADLGTVIRTNTTYVEVPVTVKDSKGKLVPGLTWRDFKVFENESREPIRVFTTDSTPLSIAFVIDQSLTSDVMAKVNSSLDALQGALAPYDEVAVFTYSNGSQEKTTFTGAQSSRLPAVLALTKATGTEMEAPITGGPFASCNIRENGNCVDPNLQAGRSAGNGQWVGVPKEIHTLNDAILAAAKELSTRPKDRRRMIYVVSDGKESGSKATYKEVVKVLQTNNIAVYGTAVGDSARWGIGYISRVHLPFTMYDNRLYGYTVETGGTLDSEQNLNGIEKSYAKVTEEARTQYTIVYSSHESIYDGKYRKIDIRVDRPGLEVIAKRGYYPSAQMSR